MTQALAGKDHRDLARSDFQTGATKVSPLQGTLPKAVVAFAGARDGYQVPLAFAEAGLLERLVTDRYFPAWLYPLSKVVDRPELVARGLPISKVRISTGALRHFVAEKLGRSSAGGWEKGAAIGKAAHELARVKRAAILSYSTSAFEALKDSQARYKFLFQFHPHPRSVRKILHEELERVPWTAPSLLSEPELALSEERFELLCQEPALADGIIVASRFTAQTLIENGITPRRIHIVPYGVDTEAFYAEPGGTRTRGTLRVAFVGGLEQRKGVSYLFEAIHHCSSKSLSLVVCSRSRPRSFWQDKLPANCEFHIGLSREKMIRVLRSCDFLALPSLVEGFGHVILEAMALRLPVIATAHTAAAEVVREGIDGFVVPIRDSMAISSRLEWALSNSTTLEEMKIQARLRACEFSWTSFRAGIRVAYERMIADTDFDHGN